MRQKRFRAFLCLYACVLFRSRPLLLFAAGFFLSFLFSLAILFSLAVTRTAFRNAPGDVFSTKESHSSPELSDALKTYENQSERGVYFRMLCLVGFSEKNIKKPEYLPRLVKISIIDFISLRCPCLDEDSQSCNEALCSLFFPLPGE
ncbi:ComEC/Rec2 family competence protein [Phocaeicola plebeius]|uniref:ComEC/Rec2 family competence protein n=1 Tax=Phocaeicola plebeius TaxID=310297 RepID=UPI0034E956CD